MTQRVFPIKTATACQLKWSHSTIFLTKLTTSSCHRVKQDPFDLKTFNFHNTFQKREDRRKMLEGQWPGRGCEHCKNIEDAGGVSDRILHLDFPGIQAPPELDVDPTAVSVTPRILEIYFSNVCNLKCIYCTPSFSSQINNENDKFGPFQLNGVELPGFQYLAQDQALATDKLFQWLDSNIDHLNKLMILGGEPFIQKETQRLLDFISGRQLPNLDLVIFSNLTVDHNKFMTQIDQLKSIKENSNLHQVNIIGSIDCWGEPAEYVRSGLDLELFQKNFEYLLANTDFILNINSVLSSLTVPTMPQLVKQINQWSQTRTVYWSLMKAAGLSYMHPTIFGSKLLDLGYTESIELFQDYGDREKKNYKEYFKGIELELAQSQPDVKKQLALKTYLIELDRRRNTDYTRVFPEIAELLKDITV